MAGLTAAVVIIGVVALLNVALTMGLARRIRLIQSVPDTRPFPPIGARPEPFRVSAVGGGTICDQDLAADSAVVAFLDAACEPCKRVTSKLIAKPPREPLFAFVGGGHDEAATSDLVRSLAPIAQVAVVEADGPAISAFGIEAFPTLLRLHDGAVVAAGERLELIVTTNGSDASR